LEVVMMTGELMDAYDVVVAGGGAAGLLSRGRVA
jgi:hypothetical protein